MKLTIFNGSPRGKESNTMKIAELFLSGFAETPGNTWEVHHLANVKHQEEFQQAYREAEVVLLIFPLYTDAMPGLVKAFIESLQPFTANPHNPPMGFWVHSGFMEAIHSRYVERYLEKLASRLNARYLGTVVKGGSEGIREHPEWMTRKFFENVRNLGRSFGQSRQFDPVLVKAIAGPEHLNWFIAKVLLPLMALSGAVNGGWDRQMKQNGVFDKSFARPYTES